MQSLRDNRLVHQATTGKRQAVVLHPKSPSGTGHDVSLFSTPSDYRGATVLNSGALCPLSVGTVSQRFPAKPDGYCCLASCVIQRMAYLAQTKYINNHSATAAGLLSPSISMVYSNLSSHWPGFFSSALISLALARTRLLTFTGDIKRSLSKP